MFEKLEKMMERFEMMDFPHGKAVAAVLTVVMVLACIVALAWAVMG